jgi:hypothetical protein
MATATDKKSPELSKFPNAEKANSESTNTLPSAFNLFTPSINAIKLNLVAFLVLVGVPIIFSLIGEASGSSTGTNSFMSYSSSGGAGIAGLIGLVLTILFAPGAIILQLKSVRKETVDYATAIKEGLTYFWRFLGLALLTLLILAVSLLLFIVPFFIVLPRIFLASYYLIDRNMGIVDSLKASAADYKAHKGVWGLIGVYVLLGLSNAIPLVGWLVSTVLLFLYTPASAIRYEQIKLLAAGKKPVTPIEASPATA